MDGLTDAYARELLTDIGGYDLCVTEFLRVTDTLYPRRVFYRRFPELIPESQQKKSAKISCTKSGTPVFLQLLGSDTQAMAENAAKAVELGALGIDLNFGCPSKTVNKSNGGASLLKYPEQLNQIVSSVRHSVPKHIPVTAKMRLGYDDQTLSHENALAIQNGGADWVTIHARTKKDGYRPPAYWDALAPISELLSIPVIANGEVWSVDDFIKCRERSCCEDVMLGRGAMVTPDLALQIKYALAQEALTPLSWEKICFILDRLYQLMITNPKLNDRHVTPRLKLWVKWLMPNYTQAEELFPQLKQVKDPLQAIQMIRESKKPLT